MTVEELEGYFTGIELPERITLESGVVVEDVPLFLESHFDYIRSNEGSKSINVYVLRLQNAIKAIENLGEEPEPSTGEISIGEISPVIEKAADA